MMTTTFKKKGNDDHKIYCTETCLVPILHFQSNMNSGGFVHVKSGNYKWNRLIFGGDCAIDYIIWVSAIHKWKYE